ncbi:Na+/H+ antiporter NhaA [Arenibacter sp. M-2]|uniref:Na+/H+ antiporter NhaA n=1 Tax=unclassified Arenibacter TaxID=2615047 RepID=UPI000D76DA8D|nr:MULTISPECIES: Na+/H+ antiporter NhaA [unclassified Arenibacter]MDL5513067.1 Na+/H+ antiporter NhaA [Arenibacter sp. M-2]PXX27260.1 sodium/proton antiporter (NhaA family) [Arenibacter sp. ARW7G5Y1]|tara:strand:+ start:47427 stop:48734 length:1308 start_codon:yes stop_codon:yes gene_type:complete
MIKRIILTPFQKFVKIESLSGVLLFSATLIAMIWANSGFSESYNSLWQYKIGIGSDAFQLTKPLSLWINDGLMALFFFLIGLEIKRELLIGELNEFRKAIFPLFAALGGMLFPLALFLFLNDRPQTAPGWGIPMATDIAFSLAILQLLGNRVPLSLKIFLTAFAIVDDLGAVLVIAIFYSGGVDWFLILYSLIPFLILSYLGFKGIYSKYMTVILGFIIWLLFLKSGIHPTIAGVLVAFTVPIRQKIDMNYFKENLSKIIEGISQSNNEKVPILSKEQIGHMDDLDDLTDKFTSPLQRLEHRLHGWVAYFIMPVFALANAGVVFSTNVDFDIPLMMNIAIALFLGKLFGITLMSWLGVKLRLALLPGDMNFVQVTGIAILAGVGFTMSIFIANLAFSDNAILIDSAKVGILIGSVVSGLVGYLVLRFSGGKKKDQ